MQIERIKSSMKVFLVFLLSFNSFAIDIVPLKKGDPSPGDGFFVAPEEMKKFRQMNEEKKILEEKVLTFKDLALVQDQRIEVHQKESQHYQERYLREQNYGTWKGIGGFVIGVLATGAISYATIRTLK